MNRKEISKIPKQENGVILLEKDSVKTFLESMLGNWASILSADYFFKRKKYDI